MTVLSPARDRLMQRARLLAWFTIGSNAFEGVVAVASGVLAGSVALVGFGLDSFVEVFAGSVVLWQLRSTDAGRERRAMRLIGVSFFMLAGYVAVDAGRDLMAGSGAADSPVGIAIALVSLTVMPLLAVAKRRTGQALGSAVVVADSKETALCSYLSLVLLVGLGLNATVGWWWADPLAALVIAVLAVREGREAWHGDTCCP